MSLWIFPTVLSGGGQPWHTTHAFPHSEEGVVLHLQAERTFVSPLLSFTALFLHGWMLGLSMLKIKGWNLILSNCLHSKTWYGIPAYA